MMKLSTRLQNAQTLYKHTKKNYESYKYIYDKIEKEVLALGWKDEEGKEVKTPSEAYYMAETDYDRYLDLVAAKYAKFDKEHKKDDTLWRHEKPLIEQEKELISIIFEINCKDDKFLEIFEGMKNNLKFRKKMIALVMQLNPKCLDR